MIEIDEYSIKLELLEYNHKEGVITQAEYTKRHKRGKYSKGQKKVQKMGQVEVYTVLRVDRSGGYIDLTKTDSLPQDQKEVETRYLKGKAVLSLMISLAEKLGLPLDYLYEKIVFPLQKNGEHASDVLHGNVFQIEKLAEKLGLEPKLAKELIEVVRLKLTPPPVKIKAIFELNTLSKNGVLDIKAVLSKAEKMSCPEVPLQVMLEATPYYTVQVVTSNRSKAVEYITQVLKVIETEITQLHGGKYDLKSFNKTSGDDEHEYAALLNMKEADDKRSVADEDNDESMGGYVDEKFD